MKKITLRLSPSVTLGALGFGFAVATLAQSFKRGTGFIAKAWSDEVFWLVMLGVFVPVYVLMRLMPAARFTEQGVTSWSYPFRIPWEQIKEWKITSFLGAPYLRVYGQRSRFALWVPLHARAREQIGLFIGKHPQAEVLRGALNEHRSN